MIPAPQMSVEDLRQRVKEAADLINEPNFKEQFDRYIFLRRWLIRFAKDISQAEEHRIDAFMCSDALKFAMNVTTGAMLKMAKMFEYKESALYGKPVANNPPVRHYFAQNLLTSACRVN
jgi:hypothetical protein